MRLLNTLPCQSPKSSCIESKWYQETLIFPGCLENGDSPRVSPGGNDRNRLHARHERTTEATRASETLYPRSCKRYWVPLTPQCVSSCTARIISSRPSTAETQRKSRTSCIHWVVVITVPVTSSLFYHLERSNLLARTLPSLLKRTKLPTARASSPQSGHLSCMPQREWKSELTTSAWRSFSTC